MKTPGKGGKSNWKNNWKICENVHNIEDIPTLEFLL